jgi:hypothetical protein
MTTSVAIPIVFFKDPWGFSKLDVFNECKAKFYYQFIKKLASPSNEAMKRGSKMHEDIEAYLQGWVTTLPPELESWRTHLDELKASEFVAEQAVGLDKDWQPLRDWFQPTTWLRSKMDAKSKRDKALTVIDFKSGKYRVPSDEQIELYAIVGHAQHPEVEEVTAEFWFIDLDDSYSRTYTAAELLALRKKYEALAAAMYNTQVWSESPSRNCKWCNYSRSRGGPCKY